MEYAALLGGVSGLIGTGLSYLIDFYKTKQELATREFEAKTQREIAELELWKVEAQSQQQVTISQAELAPDNIVVPLDQATYYTANSPKVIQYLLGFVDFLRGIIRPGTTIGYGILLGWLVVLAVTSLGAAKIAETLAVELIDSAIYLATTTTMWWFGVRPIARK